MRAPLVGLVALLAGCAQPAPQEEATGGPPPGVVHAHELRFEPAALTLRAGETVTWRVVSSNHHTVTVADPGGGAPVADSGDLGPQDTFRHSFADVGTYHVYCRYHSQGANGVFAPNEMVMEVRVE